MDSRLLGVALGLFAIYALYSAVASHLNELVSRLLKLRSKELAKTIRTKLLDDNLATELLSHPLIRSLHFKWDGVSHLPSSIFARALIDLIKSGSSGTSWKGILDEAGLPPEIRNRIAAVVGRSEESIEIAERRIAEWYDHTMDKLSAKYRHHSQLWAFVTGLVLVAVTNADTIALASNLWRDPVQRQAEIALATKYTESCVRDASGSIECPEELESSLPLGWTRAEWAGVEGARLAYAILLKILGLVITGLAISLGAPFWFDLLGRVAPKRKQPAPA